MSVLLSLDATCSLDREEKGVVCEEDCLLDPTFFCFVLCSLLLIAGGLFGAADSVAVSSTTLPRLKLLLRGCCDIALFIHF